MRQFWTRVIEILDGTPAMYAPKTTEKRTRRQRGQSLVEMAFLTPLLVLMFAGLVEIGWLANNYLNLLDITRYGARRATTLTDTRAPFSWDERSSYVPSDNVETLYEMPGTTDEEDLRQFQRETWPISGYPAIQVADDDDPLPPVDLIPSICSPTNVPDQGFYSDVICIMLASMTPLRMDPYNRVDDIVVSAFGLELVDVTLDDNGQASPDRWTTIAMRPIAPDVPQLLVVGRYPSNANECQARPDGLFDADVFQLRDPFDFNGNGFIDINTIPAAAPPGLYNENPEFEELTGFDVAGTNPTVLDDNGTPGDTSDDTWIIGNIEKQVGFSWYGNHIITDTACIGSEFTIEEVESILNLTNYAIDSIDGNADEIAERRFLPSAGVALVEMHWEHEMLLKIPVLSPVFEAFDRDGQPDLSLWAMFPLPSVEPYIEFDPDGNP